MTPGRAAGFSLIELMIGLAIAALLVVLAMPSYSTWVADAQIRNAAESIADLPESIYKESLLQLCRFAVDRNH